MISAIAIDDDPDFLASLNQMARKVSDLHLKVCFQNPELAIDYLRSHTVDLIFVDIEMDEMSGLDFIHLLKSNHKSLPKIIIISSYREYALDGFNLDVSDYLLKPLSFHRFLVAIKKVKGMDSAIEIDQEANSSHQIFVRSNRKIVKINTTKAIYLQSQDHYVKVYSTIENCIIPYRISECVELFGSRFLRVHKSYIANVDHIIEIDTQEDQIILSSEKVIPYSNSYKEFIKNLVITKRRT